MVLWRIHPDTTRSRRGAEDPYGLAAFRIDCGDDLRTGYERLSFDRKEFIRLGGLISEYESKRVELQSDVDEKKERVTKALAASGASSPEDWCAVRDILHSDIARYAYLTKEVSEKVRISTLQKISAGTIRTLSK